MNTLVLKKTIYLPRAEPRETTQGLKYVFWILAVLIFAMIVSYGLLIDKTVLNIVAHQNAETQITQLTSQIGQLQSTQIAIENKINVAYAATLGYQEVANPQFISANPSNGGALTYNTTY